MNSNRRSFMEAALGAAATAGAAAMIATTTSAAEPGRSQEPTGKRPGGAPPGGTPPMGGPPAGAPPPGSGLRMGGPPNGPKLYRVEADVRDVEVEGKIPADLNGAFYRVGPDPQYPLRPGNIPFDGEGHVSMFRIKDGHVDYKSRFVRNDRYLAQEKAKRILFPMYRNPTVDDPS
ncbi:MAG TPA: carotenoid oxygenase family protein, partial [Steroidobacteraceae bacterium]|nr:carotenoid oxygenase family protein [Steroidobacteraceae bacterium]